MATSLQSGQTLDRYTVDKLLGQGGMAVVYRVRHNQLGSFHALKVLTVASAGIRERLLQEGRVQASLRHPNVVAVTDVIDVGGNPGLVMEYVDGPSLDLWLPDNEVDLAEAERLFRGVVAGVAAAHMQGLVHRDLKPANVMLAPASGGVYLPKVTDFGLAKALFAEESVAHATRSGVTMGTPAYMAPEQIRDAKKVDHRADVFSLGCILYELVCGRPPFAGPDVLSIFNAVASGSFPPPVSLVPDLPARLQNAIQGSLVVDRDRRLPDCDALLAVLDGRDPGIPFGESGATITPDQLDGPEPIQQASTAPPADAPSLDASLSPPSGGSTPPRGRSRVVVALGVAGIAGAGVGLIGGLVTLAGWGAARWERQARQAVTTATGGEVTWEGARFRPRAVILQDLAIRGADGEPLVEAARVRVGGRWRLVGGLPTLHIRSIGADGVTLSPRRNGEGWVRPEQTLEALRDVAGAAGGLHLDRLATGPTTLRATGATGTLDGFVSRIVLEDVRLDPGGERVWTAEDLSVGTVRLEAGDPVFTASGAELADGVLGVDGVETWVRIREDGLLDLPPVVADVAPDWLGGRDHGVDPEPWFGLKPSWLPAPAERLELGAATVHVFDRAHAPGSQRWILELDRTSLGPVAAGWLPIDAAGRLGSAPVTLQGDLREDGLVRGRVGLRHLELKSFAPYLDLSLRHYKVEPASGALSITADFTMKADSFAGRFEGQAEDVAFVPVPRAEGAPLPPAAATRLAAPRPAVPVRTEVSGSLADRAFRPVDIAVYAVAEALFGPAGGAVGSDPARVAPTTVASRTRARGTPTPAPEPVASAPVLEPATDETPRPAPTDEEQTKRRDGERTFRVLDRFRREVEDALEDLEAGPREERGGGR